MKKIFLIVSLYSVTLLQAQEKLPNLKIKNTDGKSIDLIAYTKEKTVVFSFWATWCVPCINELDAISEDYEDLKNDLNFELIAVSTDDSRTRSRVRPLVNGKDWDYMVLLDSNQDFKRAMNISLVPHVVIVKSGSVVYSHSGYTPGGEQELYAKLKELL